MSNEERKPVNQHFTVKDQANDYHWSVARGHLRLFPNKTSRGEYYWLGEFLDPRGIVTIMREQKLTRLDYVLNGTAYSRSWRKHFGDRTLAKLARAFITEIQEKDHPND